MGPLPITDSTTTSAPAPKRRGCAAFLVALVVVLIHAGVAGAKAPSVRPLTATASQIELRGGVPVVVRSSVRARVRLVAVARASQARRHDFGVTRRMVLRIPAGRARAVVLRLVGHGWRDLGCTRADLVIRLQLMTHRRDREKPHEVVTRLRRHHRCEVAPRRVTPVAGTQAGASPHLVPAAETHRPPSAAPVPAIPTLAGRTPDTTAADGQRCVPAPYPSVLHTRPPSQAGGDVSGAFVDSSGCELTLDGFNMFAIYDDPARVAFGQPDFDDIRARGFTVVRFVMPWASFQSSPDRVDHLDLLDIAVERARAAGLYVVLDLLHVDPTNRPPGWTGAHDDLEAIEDDARAWVQTVAERYRDEPAVAAYDLVNEPASTDRNRVLELYSKMIGWVREVAPAKIAMVNAAMNGNSSMDRRYADADHLRYRGNVVHTTHDYYAGDPTSATESDGYGPSGIVQGFFTADGRTGYYDRDDQADFRAHLDDDVDFARRADVPLWIGEFGIGAAAVNSGEWIADKVDLYNRLHLGRAWWLYGCEDPFGVKDAECRWRATATSLLVGHTPAWGRAPR